MGSAIDEVRGAELTAVLAEHPDLLVVEDDHASGAVDSPYVSVLGDRPRWALIRSMSKSLGPDLRIAMIGADPTTASRVEGRQQVGTGWVSHLIQELTVQLWREKDTADRLRGAQRAYSRRREAFLTELTSRGVPARGRSGLNVYVPVPEEVPVVRQLFDRGWAVQAGEPYRLASRPFIRVTTAALDPSDGAELAGHIAAALHATAPARVSRAG
jgi:DNA-binding transcriptional MocR family regulator